MSSMQCRICGSITGEHGFSFDDKAIAAQAAERKKNAGILCIPRSLLPEGTSEDDFLSEINDSLTQYCAPEVRWMDDDDKVEDIFNRSSSDRW